MQQQAVERQPTLTHTVFVYGTLKRGQPNHDLLQVFGSCQFVATGCTELKYPLIIATDSNLPFLLDAPGEGQIVYGEVYYIDDQCLAQLDEFEGHPDLYQRDIITVRMTLCDAHQESTSLSNNVQKKDTSVKCYTYLRKHFDQALLDLATFSSYDSFGSHGRSYSRECDNYSDGSNIDEALSAECSRT